MEAGDLQRSPTGFRATRSPSKTKEQLYAPSPPVPLATPFVAVACGSDSAPAPSEEATATPEPTSAQEPISISSVLIGALDLDLLTSVLDQVSEMPWATIVGEARPDAVVTVNGETVEVDIDGLFTLTIPLEEGPNLVETIASSFSGETSVITSFIFHVAAEAGLPLLVFYPTEGLETSNARVRAFGGTELDAVVAVGGVPVSIDERGLFEATVPLQQGPNLVEVVASSVTSGEQHVVSRTVFYVP